MGSRGPAPKSAAVRIAEGERAHRPLPAPAPTYAYGMPERPRGLSAGARHAWAEYIAQLAPLGVLRRVDGFALGRLCEDVAYLSDLQKGARQLARQIGREAKAADVRLRGSALVTMVTSIEGRRLMATINALAGRIKRDEVQFGLTPVASARLETVITPFPVAMQASSPGMDPAEAALCG